MLLWEYGKAFLTGGVLCVLGQLLIDYTRLTPARILTGYVVAGVVLGALGLYGPLADWAGAGATVPLTGFGWNLAKGVKQAVAEQGLLPPAQEEVVEDIEVGLGQVVGREAGDDVDARRAALDAEEAQGFLPPVERQMGRRHDDRREEPVRREHGEGLHGLAQAHLVGEQGAVVLQQKRQAFPLEVHQRALEGAGRRIGLRGHPGGLLLADRVAPGVGDGLVPAAEVAEPDLEREAQHQPAQLRHHAAVAGEARLAPPYSGAAGEEALAHLGDARVPAHHPAPAAFVPAQGAVGAGPGGLLVGLEIGREEGGFVLRVGLQPEIVIPFLHVDFFRLSVLKPVPVSGSSYDRREGMSTGEEGVPRHAKTPALPAGAFVFQVTLTCCFRSRTSGWPRRSWSCRRTGRKSGTRRSRRSWRSRTDRGCSGSGSWSWQASPLHRSFPLARGEIGFSIPRRAGGVKPCAR